MKVKCGNMWLADGTRPGGRFAGFQGGSGDEWQVEVVQPIRAAVVDTRDRGNRAVTCSFAVTRIHPTQDVADAFVLQHGGSIPRFAGAASDAPAALAFTTTTDGGTDRTIYLRRARLRSCTLTDQRGVHTEHAYTFVGSEYTTQP